MAEKLDTYLYIIFDLNILCILCIQDCSVHISEVTRVQSGGQQAAADQRWSWW